MTDDERQFLIALANAVPVGFGGMITLESIAERTGWTVYEASAILTSSRLLLDAVDWTNGYNVKANGTKVKSLLV